MRIELHRTTHTCRRVRRTPGGRRPCKLTASTTPAPPRNAGLRVWARTTEIIQHTAFGGWPAQSTDYDPYSICPVQEAANNTISARASAGRRTATGLLERITKREVRLHKPRPSTNNKDARAASRHLTMARAASSNPGATLENTAAEQTKGTSQGGDAPASTLLTARSLRDGGRRRL